MRRVVRMPLRGVNIRHRAILLMLVVVVFTRVLRAGMQLI
jgi:hypothetical protein